MERLLIYLNFLVSTSELLVEVWTGNYLRTELRATPVSKIVCISFLIESNRNFGEKNSPTGSLIKHLNITISSISDFSLVKNKKWEYLSRIEEDIEKLLEGEKK